ncbi:flagellar biosynthetic protein FliR [Steroidobacter sp.]|uniref:flagellar biosynthetic protein FliR n=1 Tax=Steroidobacter sp. TaxID=1978227 RepID=UPI001A4ADFCA|nr:flagellar biosynthetic protein FliR [Steroidobacter sp.]MBL8265461.1 flagellar biosynthetic protein FliR [Steroidobacter sp.]
METVLQQLPTLLSAVWWPFCRVLGMLNAAPIIGENMVPITVRVLLSVVLAVIFIPVAQPVTPIDPLSAHALVVTINQALLGFGLGLAFHLTMAVMQLLGFVVSSQMGLSMAVMNDPMSGTSSDVIATMLYLLCVLVFFGIDGHLVLAQVIGASFHAWPVGGPLDLSTLRDVAYNVAWVFSAAMLLAIPVVFSTLVVQIGFGLLNRIAPALNLYSLGFAAIIVFGLYMLSYLVRVLPDHYLRLTQQVLELLRMKTG